MLGRRASKRRTLCQASRGEASSPGRRREQGAAQDQGGQAAEPQAAGPPDEVTSPDTTSSPTEPPAKAPKQTQAAPAPADDSSSSSSSTDSPPPQAGGAAAPAPRKEGEGDAPPQDVTTADDMTAWSRRIVRKTSARKSRAQPPSSDEDKGAALPRAARAAEPANAAASTTPAGDVAPTPPTSAATSSIQTAPGQHGGAPSAKAEEKEGATPLADAAPMGAEEATAPGTSPPSGDEELTLRVECKVEAFSTTISVKISPREIAAKLLRICWERTGLKGLEVLRVAGSELDLSLPLGLQLRQDERFIQAAMEDAEPSPASPPAEPPVLAAVAGGPVEVVATPKRSPQNLRSPEQDQAPRRGLPGPPQQGQSKKRVRKRLFALLSSQLTACFASLAM